MNATAFFRSHGLGLTIAATSLGFLLVQLDVSILNVALTQIGKAEGTGVTGLQWVVDAYTIAFASLLLTAGTLGDRIGARRTYIGGLALFKLCLAWLRAPAGDRRVNRRTCHPRHRCRLSATPLTCAADPHTYSDDSILLARAISLGTVAGSVALAAGPVLGGVLADTLGWRSIFLVNLPLGAAGIWFTRCVVVDTTLSNSGVDLSGQMLALMRLASLTAAAIEGGGSASMHRLS